jgi:hypothetical protein
MNIFAVGACLLIAGSIAVAQDKPAQEKKKLEPPGIKKEQLKGEALENWRKKHDTSGEDFEKNGAPVGATIGSLKVSTMAGGATDLAQTWRDRPALIVTASLTCGHSRERQPEVEKLAAKYKDAVNVVVLYTLEAHPVGSASPYAIYSPESEESGKPGERSGGAKKAGLERRQPQTGEQRKALAREFQDRLQVKSLMVLDEMSNAAWKALGGGPNMGLLVGRGGKVVVKHGWFDGASMDKSIQYYLDEQKKATSR